MNHTPSVRSNCGLIGVSCSCGWAAAGRHTHPFPALEDWWQHLRDADGTALSLEALFDAVGFDPS